MGKAIPRSKRLKGDPLSVTVTQARQMLNIGPTLIYELITSGELESFMLGSRRLIRYRSIKRLMGGAPGAPAPVPTEAAPAPAFVPIRRSPKKKSEALPERKDLPPNLRAVLQDVSAALRIVGAAVDAADQHIKELLGEVPKRWD